MALDLTDLGERGLSRDVVGSVWDAGTLGRWDASGGRKKETMHCAPARPRSWTVTGRTRVNAQLTVRVTGGADMAA